MTENCVMTSTVEMQAAESKTGIRSTSALNRSSVKKWTMITMVPIMTNLTENVLPRGAQCRRSQGTFP
jgi:hypothetical protein